MKRFCTSAAEMPVRDYIGMLLTEEVALKGTLDGLLALYLDEPLFPLHAADLAQCAPHIQNPFVIGLGRRELLILPLGTWRPATVETPGESEESCVDQR